MSNFLDSLRAQAKGSFDGYSDDELARAFYETTPKMQKYSYKDFSNGIGLGQRQQQAENNQGYLMDAVSYFGEGAGQLAKMAGGLYGMASGDMDNPVSQVGDSAINYWRDPSRRSSRTLGKEQAIQTEVDAADGEWAKLGTTLWETLKRPEMIPLELAKQIPNFVGMGGAGAVAGKVAAKHLLAQGLERELVKKGAEKAAVRTAISTEAVMEGADSGTEAYEEMMKLKQDVWDKNQDYQNLVARGYEPERAKHEISLNGARWAAG